MLFSGTVGLRLAAEGNSSIAGEPPALVLDRPASGGGVLTSCCWAVCASYEAKIRLRASLGVPQRRHRTQRGDSLFDGRRASRAAAGGTAMSSDGRDIRVHQVKVSGV